MTVRFGIRDRNSAMNLSIITIIISTQRLSAPEIGTDLRKTSSNSG